MALTSYRVRAATEADVPRLPGIEGRAAARFADVGLAAAMDLPLHEPSALLVAVNEKRLLVAADDADVAVAFAVLESHPDGDAHLLELDAEPTHSGSGIGRALIAASIDWARSRGLARLTLTTFRDIPFNAPFYERVGFRVLEGDALGPRLATLLAQEVAFGVAIAPRVAMAIAIPV